MRVCVCDLCHRQARELRTLYPVYSVDGVTEVCPSCLTMLEEHKAKLEREAAKVVMEGYRTFMKAKLAARNPIPDDDPVKRSP